MTCPVCSNKANFEFVESHNNYKIIRCPVCSLEFSMPMMAAKQEFYLNTEWYGIRWEFYKTLNFLKGKVDKILEIACGEGFFMSLAIKAGFLVSGIDFNEKAIQIAKEKHHLEKIYPWTLDEFIKNFPEERFGAVCFFHLLEHIEDPVNFIFTIKKILKPGGFIVFSLPATHRVEFYIYGREEWDYPPHHLTRWNPKSVEKLIELTQLKIIHSEIEPLTVERITNILFSRIRFGSLNKIKESGQEIHRAIGYSLNLKQILITTLARIKKILLFPFACLFYLNYKMKGLTGQSVLYVTQSGD